MLHTNTIITPKMIRDLLEKMEVNNLEFERISSRLQDMLIDVKVMDVELVSLERIEEIRHNAELVFD